MNQNEKTSMQKHWLKLVVIFTVIGIVLVSLLFFVNIGTTETKWNTQSNIEGFEINNSTGALQDTLNIYIDNASLYAEQLRVILSEELASDQNRNKSNDSI